MSILRKEEGTTIQHHGNQCDHGLPGRLRVGARYIADRGDTAGLDSRVGCSSGNSRHSALVRCRAVPSVFERGK